MLYDELKRYAKSGVYPFHMPGHKRNPAFMPGCLSPNFDITEIHGFDDLHNPAGVLSETQKSAATLYGSRDAFLLVNGSTVGNLAAIGAHTVRGGKILIESTCHRSVSNAAKLFDLTPVIIAPDVDKTTGIPISISPDAVKSALEDNPGLSFVVITSPTYEGVVSDIAAISNIVHEAGALLHVDSAHGAHLGFSDGFPQSPVMLGADTVVVSLHKTLPALTQCSLLHICSCKADTYTQRIQANTLCLLGILQTSSPSYMLMASIDYCLRLLSTEADKLFSDYADNLAYFAERVSCLKHLKIAGKKPGIFDFDPGKIVIVTKDTTLSGAELTNLLREKHKLELERATDDYVIAMTSICDTREGFTRLADALTEIDMQIGV